MESIPTLMKALQVDAYHEDIVEALHGLRIIEKPTPSPSWGSVLVKVEAAPCNPSDLLLLQGKYGKTKPLPTIPGWEGAGIVVSSGGGLLGRWLLGKRVAFAMQSDADGTWAQYCAPEAKNCIPLKSGVDVEQGSTLIVNPLTAIGLVDTALKGNHTAIIQTGSASQVGRMVLALAKEEGMPVIHVVRRKEQEELLRKMGAEHVLVSESADFFHCLKEQAKALGATIAFDAVGGSLTGILFAAMPAHSKVLVYGALAGAPCSGISPLGLIFQMKSLEGFWLTQWLSRKNIWGVLRASSRVQRLMAAGIFHTAIRERASLERAPGALEAYAREMTQGKVILTPQSRETIL